MVYKVFYFLFFLFTISVSYAQLENYIWYFGDNLEGIRFDLQNRVPSIIDNQYTPYTNEGCSVVSNPVTGELLYYSDGIRTIDRNNNVMPNGTGLLGSPSSAQSGWSCSVPYECNKFYVFSNSAVFETNPSGDIYYSIVDMGLPGNGSLTRPLGDIDTAFKNVLLVSNASEALTLIEGGKKYELWLLSFQYNSSSIRVFKIDSLGIALTNTYNIGYVFQDARAIRYSPVSGKICITGMYGTDPVLICDFDNTNGLIFNPFQIPGSPFFNVSVKFWGAYDSEWSSDGTKLYISFYRWYNSSSGGRLYQYDLNYPTLPPKLIFDNAGNASNTGRGLQMGPDGKIYWLYNSSSLNNTTRYIGVVNQPNQPGLSCGFDPLGLDMLNDLERTHKFPNFLIYNNQKPIAVNDSISPPNCIKKTGDINVLLNDKDPDNDSLTVSVLSVKYGTASILPDNFLQYAAPANYSNMDTIIYSISDNRCFPLRDTAKVIISLYPSIDLGTDTSICEGSRVLLNAGPGFESYTWQDRSLEATYEVNKGGLYWVQVKNQCGEASDSIQVKSYSLPRAVAGNDTAITYGSAIELHACCGLIYSWSPRKSLSDTSAKSPIVNPVQNTEYILKVTDSTGCSAYDSVEVKVLFEIFIPTLFSPNEDQHNDYFKLYGGGVRQIRFEIYDRYGQQIYYSESMKEVTQQGWDGKYEGQDQPEGTYVWKMTGKFVGGNALQYKGSNTGTFLLIR